jgi:hypothetical protein
MKWNSVLKECKPLAPVCLSLGFLTISAFAGPVPVYSTLPTPTPGDYAQSLPYSVYSITEFGALVSPDSSAILLSSAEVGVSNWSTNSYSVPMLLTLYYVNSDGSVGAEFAASSTTASIQGRPADSQACGAGQYLDGNSQCQYGMAQVVDFTFDGETLPSQFIYGLSFDPTIDPSLNLGFTFADAFPGTTINPDTLYLNTSSNDTLCGLDTCDPSYGSLNVFGPNPGWNNEVFSAGVPTIEFDATIPAPVPEPATLGLIGLGLICCSFKARNKTRHL